jgi:hypothetical protein
MLVILTLNFAESREIPALCLARRHDRSLAGGERELKNTALILAEYTDRALQSIELAQKSILDSMQSAGISSSEQLRREMSTETIHQLLKDKISGLPHVDSLTIIDADGNLVNSSRTWPARKINVSDRDRFIALKSNPQLTLTLISNLRAKPNQNQNPNQILNQNPKHHRQRRPKKTISS